MTVPVDPYDFTNGSIADADQVDLRFKRLYDALNPAVQGLDGTNVTANFVFPLRTIVQKTGAFSGLTGTPLLIGDPVNIISTTSVRVTNFAIPFDPADYAITGKTTRLRIRCYCVQNAVSAGVNLTVAMYTVTPSGGASGSASSGGGAIGQVTGSTVNLTPAGSGTYVPNQSADFAPPAAGMYALAVFAQSGTQAAGSVLDVGARLDFHHV